MLTKTVLILLSIALAVCNQAGEPIDAATQRQISGLEASINTLRVDFYNKYDAIFDYCGSEGYLEKFIIPYSNAYLNAREDFISKEWQDGVRYCLQRALWEKSKDLTTFPTCKEISDWGFSSHVGCYMRPVPEKPEITWCTLPFPDQARVAWIARGAFWEVLNQGFPILFKCLTGQTRRFLE